jgi:hypothetical protein
MLKMADSSDELLCYNKGCGKRYRQENNNDDACQYHNGSPVFHDALKGWSCCKKRSTDFTEFLNIPGCTKGPHNNTRPKEVQKEPETPLEKGEVISVGTQSIPPQALKVMERPSEGGPMIKLKFSVSQSLKNQLKKLACSTKQPEVVTKTSQVEEGDGGVKIGTKCVNRGCSEMYVDSSSDLGECLHHPGAPIFHEGYKFYTCCQRRTTDFNEFLRQEGCTTGSHKWIDDKASNDMTFCRKDFHQTAKYSVVAVYAKHCVPEECTVEANATTVCLM